MHFLALATDYDGTLATDGKVSPRVLKTLIKFRESGRKLILVTGRELDDLKSVFPQHDAFDLIVAENGALLYQPSSQEQTRLAPKPDEGFVSALEKRGVKPLFVGKSIIATREPHHEAALEVIRELGLELQMIFNKGAVMILPPGINKSSGLSVALRTLGIAAQNVIAVGDAENDHALLQGAGLAVAVKGAIKSLKKSADWITRGDEGAGVSELIDEVLEDEHAMIDACSNKHRISIGRDSRGKKVRIPGWHSMILIAGPSGSGKTSATLGVLERIIAKGNQFCIVDPEGDYGKFPGAIHLGDPKTPPSLDEVKELLERFENPVVNLLGVSLTDRPIFFSKLLAEIQELRGRTGRPHWLVIDEAHHLFPKDWKPAPVTVPTHFHGTLLVTVHPDEIAPEVVEKVTHLIAVGQKPRKTIGLACKATGSNEPRVPKRLGKRKSDAVLWARGTKKGAIAIELNRSSIEHDRHQKKYAQGDLEEDSFYFRGPNSKMNLRVHNLTLFTQIADGIDDATWMHHLKRGDYSKWIRRAIQDKKLSRRIERIENAELSSEKSRQEIKKAIEETYTAAA